MKTSAICLSALGLLASPTDAMSDHRWVIVVGRADDPRVVRQQADMARDAAALQERDVWVQVLAPDVARRFRPELRLGSQTTFEVLLVGKDGGVKLRRNEPVAASEIAALIDTMPMRQEEMKR